MSGVNDIRSASSNSLRATATPSCRPRRWCRATTPPCCSPMPAWCSSRTSSPGREAALCARHHGAEMRARRRQAQRSRQCRLYRPPPHLLRDAGQFLLRRLFQGRRDRARLGPRHQGIRPGQGHGCWSRSIPPTTRRAGSGRRSPACPTTASSAMTTISGRWGRRVRAAIARRSSTTRAPQWRAARPASPDEDGDRFLEFWNLVFMQFEQVDEKTRLDLPQALHRHRHGAGAHRRHPAGRHQQLRHRPVSRPDRGVANLTGVDPHGLQKDSATASSPIICAPRRS